MRIRFILRSEMICPIGAIVPSWGAFASWKMFCRVSRSLQLSLILTVVDASTMTVEAGSGVTAEAALPKEAEGGRQMHKAAKRIRLKSTVLSGMLSLLV